MRTIFLLINFLQANPWNDFQEDMEEEYDGYNDDSTFQMPQWFQELCSGIRDSLEPYIGIELAELVVIMILFFIALMIFCIGVMIWGWWERR